MHIQCKEIVSNFLRNIYLFTTIYDYLVYKFDVENHFF